MMSYKVKKGFKISKGGAVISPLDIEKEFDEKTIASLVKKKILVKNSKKNNGEN